MKIQDAVRSAIEGNPLYALILSTGLANLSAVARAIKPLIDAATGKDVKIPTIVKALERLGKAAEEATAPLIGFKDVEVFTHSGVAEAEGESIDLNALRNSGEPFIAISDGMRTKILASARLLGRSDADKGLVRIVFSRQAPVGAVTFLVQLMRAVGVSPEHVLRHDNELYIVARREDVPRVLDLVEKMKKLSEGNILNVQ